MPIISHIYMNDLFFPFIYQKSKTEIIEQISLYLEDLPIVVKEKDDKEEEKVAIIDIL